MAEAQQHAENLVALSIQTQGGAVIVPDIAIAEIVDFEDTEKDKEYAPDWYLGKLLWRNLQVPLVSLEIFDGRERFHELKSLKIIVVHSTSSREKMEYWAFVALETPRMLRLSKGELMPSEAALTECSAMAAEFQGEVMQALDMAKVETALVGFV